MDNVVPVVSYICMLGGFFTGIWCWLIDASIGETSTLRTEARIAGRYLAISSALVFLMG